ncbi:MAG: phosphoglycerate dehydrogenase [Thermodesulfobacteriota bacterium]|nr:phosphoglycerate dehydrogenase [Thermodesulfobacteriota bacterium]
MKVLIADNIDEAGIRALQDEAELEVDVRTEMSPEELRGVIPEYDGMIVRSATKVTSEIIEAGVPRLKAIARAGIGLDNVDVHAATRHGIAVMNTPEGNTVTTAEHTIAMMMALTRNIPQGTMSLKSGQWNKKQLQGREVFSKTLGVIGFGKIGSIVADRARQFKMRVIVHDPNLSRTVIENEGFEYVSLEDIYRQSDYVTVHVPKLKQTTGLLNRAAFDQMREGVMVINCARGGIVDEKDLFDAIKSGKVAGAALDVFDVEPPGESPLFALDNVVATPHLGASTKEAQINVSEAAARQIIQYLKYKTVINAVNLPAVSGELLEKLGPFMTLADRMGCLLAQFSGGSLTEIKIEYTGDFLGLDLGPVTTAAVQGVLAPLVKHHVNSVNASALAGEMGIPVTTKSATTQTDYINLITMSVNGKNGLNTVAGTIFGRKAPRIIRINDFRLEMIPTEGYFAIIHNLDQPGAIGRIGLTLGEHGVNIERMQVGQKGDNQRNIIFLRTGSKIPAAALTALRALPVVKDVTVFELDER